MSSASFPWRQPRDIQTLLAEVKPILVSLSVVEPGAGCSDREITAAEKRSRPFPEDVRAFYRSMRPTELFGSGRRKEFGFYTIESDELTWQSMEEAEPAEDWAGAQGLFLGQSQGGDSFWLTESHRYVPDGSIFLLDHGAHLSEDVMFAHFARSFSEFLAKIAYFKSLDSAAKDDLFCREYLELNPSVRR